jgi:hypothetical protein
VGKERQSQPQRHITTKDHVKNVKSERNQLSREIRDTSLKINLSNKKEKVFTSHHNSSFNLNFSSNSLCLLSSLFDISNHVKGSLWQIIMFSIQDLLETPDSILQCIINTRSLPPMRHNVPHTQ